jgi:serine/threonine protein kinase/cephalosporin-C deacetylase-like acetyl esterase
MDKCFSEKDFDILLSESAGSGKTTRQRQHLRICDTCAARLAELRIGSKKQQRTISPDTMRDRSNTLSRVSLEPNIDIGDFRIEKRLGTGGMGVVYQAYQISLKRRVALKVLGVNLLTNESATERFRREARAAAKLQNPNIVSIYEEGVEDGLCYYAMELVEGKNLSELIVEIRQKKSEPQELSDTKTKLTEIFDTRFGIDTKLSKSYGSREHFDNIARVITETADALDYAHQNGVIHRDIKPSNLILSNGGRLMITDFGIAHVIDDNALTLTGSFLGTPLYMSPEQISESRNIDHRTDIYSLGATLYELLTLQPLFKGLKTHEQAITHILNKIPAKPRSIDDQIPVDLETVCCKAIESSPDRRYQSAGELADDLRRFLNRQVIKARPAGVFDKLSKLVERHKTASALSCVTLIVAVFAVSFAWKNIRDHRVQNIIPKITQLIEQKKFFDAFVLAKKVERIQPNAPMLDELWLKMTRQYSINTDPAGGDLYIRDYFNDQSDWIKIGRSPLEDVRVPFGTQSWKVEKEGFVPKMVARSNEFVVRQGDGSIEKGSEFFYLQEVGKYPEDMIWIPPSNLQQMLFHNFVDVGDGPAYLIDKYEVTNKQFKEFIDQGGYENAKYWVDDFIKDDKFLTWREAKSFFVDSTGKHGPSSWANGSYAEGQGEYPVSGVSWYEAAAYATFQGKDLPTVFHWLLATIDWDAGYRIVLRSNFSNTIVPVGFYKGIGKFGIYDGAGNVREWCYNAVGAEDGQRCILGGAYSDPTYMFVDNHCVTPWERDIRNGFRCVRYLGGKEKVPEVAFDFLVRVGRDLSDYKPEPKEMVQSYIDTLYQYDELPLNSSVEASQELDYCRLERVSYDAAYPERIPSLLFIPKNTKPPYQTVVWFPGSNAAESSWDIEHMRREVALIVKSGRAILYPFYQGTWSRRTENSRVYDESIISRNLNIQRALDLRRSIDYIDFREDLDSEKIAYAGLSWGASIGPVMMAIENRIKTGICLLGGLCDCKRHPAYDAANFARFVKTPVLMINGREDSIHTYKSQRYIFESLGTPEKNKKHVVFPGGHSISWEFRDEYDKTILDWLDMYLGPVK